MAQLEDRDALYYPYIHIQDVNWLKATLLSFPQVRRMVPMDFYLNDKPEIKSFREIEGANNKPLLAEEPLDSNAAVYPEESAVQKAQKRLLQRFQESEKYIIKKCSRQATKKQYGTESNSFQIHGDKVIAGLWGYLQGLGLAWPVRKTKGGYMPWFALHPLAGEAIMSTLAIALARDKGLDIVTTSGAVHHALVTQSEEEAFDTILLSHVKPPEPSGKMDVSAKVNQLTEVFMHTYFDLNRLTPEQIGELVRNGNDLRSFKKALLPIAESIPDIPNAKERKKRLRDGAHEVLAEWRKHKKSLPKYALDAILEAGKEIKIPDFVNSLVAGASGFALGGAIGLGIGFLTYSAYKVWSKFDRDMSHPYQYLSRIEKSGATLVLQGFKMRH